MTRNSLIVTLDGPGTDESGVLVEDSLPVLDGVIKAVQLMVGHLGGRPPGRGRVPDWVRDQSRLRLSSTRPGSFVAELTLDPPPNRELSLVNFGEQAVSALSGWDGREGSTLPPAVTRRLRGAASGLSDGSRLWLGSNSEPRRVEVIRHEAERSAPVEAEDALLQGWLKEVNWAKGTAQLHSYTGGYVRLRFDQSLEEEMLKLATQHVEVAETGRFSREGDPKTVTVNKLSQERSWSEPFDMDAFLNTADARVFNTDRKVSVDLADEEWEYFNRAIREGREV